MGAVGATAGDDAGPALDKKRRTCALHAGRRRLNPADNASLVGIAQAYQDRRHSGGAKHLGQRPRKRHWIVYRRGDDIKARIWSDAGSGRHRIVNGLSSFVNTRASAPQASKAPHRLVRWAKSPAAARAMLHCLTRLTQAVIGEAGPRRQRGRRSCLSSALGDAPLAILRTTEAGRNEI